MPIPFRRSLRALATDHPRSGLVAAATGGLLLALWGTWFVAGRVSVYEVSVEARLEADREVHPVASVEEGRIVAVHVQAGDRVKAGDPILDLDTELQQLRLKEERERLTATDAELAALEQELDAQEGVLGATARKAEAGREEARSRYEEARAAAEYARDELARTTELSAGGNVAEAEQRRAEAEAERTRAAAEAARQALDRTEWEQRSEEGDREVKRRELEGQVALLRGQLAVSQATVTRLEAEIARRRITAPVDGIVGEMAPLPVGAVVAAGQVVGSVVPPGELKAVAEFAPQDALGRVLPNQRGRLLLDGFPWTQFGVVPVTVSRVSAEARDGEVRVDLAVDPGQTSIPLQHGLPGTVEVEVERVSPATLALRWAGALLSHDAPSAQ